jgi:hypothetical protein
MLTSIIVIFVSTSVGYVFGRRSAKRKQKLSCRLCGDDVSTPHDTKDCQFYGLS